MYIVQPFTQRIMLCENTQTLSRRKVRLRCTQPLREVNNQYYAMAALPVLKMLLMSIFVCIGLGRTRTLANLCSISPAYFPDNHINRYNFRQLRHRTPYDGPRNAVLRAVVRSVPPPADRRRRFLAGHRRESGGGRAVPGDRVQSACRCAADVG